MGTLEGDLRAGDDADDVDAAVAPLIRRAPRISQSDVFQAADELLVEGHWPTIDRVRMRLGRGSPNTINDHLDAWWTKLGARLRDLPGQEFPQLPERVAQTLQRLWNEALESAHEVLQATLLEREQALAQREQALQSQTQQLTEREHAGVARAAGLEESLALAREQLSAANRRAERLEATVQERDAESNRLRVRIEAVEASSAELQRKLDAATAEYQAERTRLQEHYAATERRWLSEVDRARQGTKEAVHGHEHAVKELREQIGRLQTEREQLRAELVQARAELKAVAGVREPLEAYLREHARVSATQVRPAQRKVTRARKHASRRGARLRSKRVSDS
jgi:chromosome segregation ATPase